MRRLIAVGLLAAAPAVAGARNGGVLVVTRPDGSKQIYNIAPALSGRGGSVPNGSAERREELWPKVEETARAHGLDPRLVDLVIRMESGYNPVAVSSKGARGVMQLTPSTAKLYGVANPFDPWENINGGVRYLADLVNRFGTDLSLALAAYNAGPDAVEKYGGVPPYEETRNYVSSILNAYEGGGGPLLSGGFGRVTKRARPVELVQEGGSTLISNVRRSGEPAFDRRLKLR